MDRVILFDPCGAEADSNWRFEIPKDGWINEITVYASIVIDCLEFKIIDPDKNATLMKFGVIHPDSKPAKVLLEANEHVRGMSGTSGVLKEKRYVTSLTFSTTSPDGAPNKHGPYGNDSSPEIQDPKPFGEGLGIKGSNVAGFFGRTDDYISSIGFYMNPL